MRTWASDPPVIAAGLVEISGVPIDRLRSWFCPCCSECKAVFAQDADGHVWLALAESFSEHDRNVFRLDERQEVDELPLHAKDDGFLLQAWYPFGLYDELARLFAS